MLRVEVRKGKGLALFTHRVGREEVSKVEFDKMTLFGSQDRSEDESSELRCLVIFCAMRLECSMNDGKNGEVLSSMKGKGKSSEMAGY